MNQKLVQFTNLHESITSLAGFDFAIECEGVAMLHAIINDTVRRYSTGQNKNLILGELARLDRDITHNTVQLAQMYGCEPSELKSIFVLTAVVERHGYLVQHLTALLYTQANDYRIVYAQVPVILILNKEKLLWETIGQIAEPQVNEVKKPPPMASYALKQYAPAHALPKNQP